MRRVVTSACIAWIVMWFAVTPVMAETASMASGSLPPWHFHMTPDEVKSFKDYGPYKSLPDGSLTTHSAVFNGGIEYVEFAFQDGGLARMGVYLYYGTDITAAAHAWGRSYTALKSLYGDVPLPSMTVYKTVSPPTEESVGEGGSKIVLAGGKSRIMPAHDPADAHVFSTFRSVVDKGETRYYVILYYEPPRS
jgi:hypothetical protein